MSRFSVKFENVGEVAKSLEAFGSKAGDEIGKAVQVHALDVRSDIQRRIQRGPKTGREYLRRSVSHRASAPGEAPATDTGTLVSSIVYRRDGDLAAEIESRLGYATFLEFGTVHIAPRPSWTPSIEDKMPDFVRRVSDAIRSVM